MKKIEETLMKFLHQFSFDGFKAEHTHTSDEFYVLFKNIEDQYKIEEAIEKLKTTNEKTQKVTLSSGETKEFSIWD